jgi:hypothetical protein
MELIGIIQTSSLARPFLYFPTYPVFSRRICLLIPHKRGDKVRCYVYDDGACIPLEILQDI